MGGFLRHLCASWTWRMAWRDSRTSRRRLLLFSTSIVLGIAALVALNSFGKSLAIAIDMQARALLGADLVLAGRQPFAQEEESLFQSIGGEQAREVEFNSMIVFPNSGSTRLVHVRGLDGPFPFYGKLELNRRRRRPLFARAARSWKRPCWCNSTRRSAIRSAWANGQRALSGACAKCRARR